MLLLLFGQPSLCSNVPRLLPPIICAHSHLLLVFPLGVEASLDALPGFLEGLPLGALSGVMGAHSHDVGTGENQHVGHYL